MQSALMARACRNVRDAIIRVLSDLFAFSLSSELAKSKGMLFAMVGGVATRGI